MSTFDVLLCLPLLCFGMVVFSQWTAAARARLAELKRLRDQAKDAASREGRASETVSATPRQTPAPAPEATAPAETPPVADPKSASHNPWNWGGKLLTPAGFLGLLSAPVEAVILLLNSYILAMGLSLAFGQQPTPWFTFSIGTYYRDVTLFDVAGLVLTLCDFLAGAVVLAGRVGDDDERHRIPPLVCAVATVVLVLVTVFAVGVGVWAGYLTHGPAGAALRGLLAAGMVAVGVLIGYLVVDRFLVPLALFVGLFPVWVVEQLLAWRREALRRKPPRERKPQPPQGPVVFVGEGPVLVGGPSPAWVAILTVLSAADEYVLDPLRRLDEWVASKLIRRGDAA
jgi:hypothetical protein